MAHRFDNLDTLKSAVTGTGCFAILPRASVTAELEQGRLTTVALRPPLARPIALIHRLGGKRGEHLSPAASAFAAFLAEHADPAATPDPTASAPAPRIVGAA